MSETVKEPRYKAKSIKWHKKPWGLEGWVFFIDHEKREGEYRLTAQRRPHYCDRGDWTMLVDSRGAKSELDGHDGFPRYFFGDEAAVKAQFALWVAKRKECQEHKWRQQTQSHES